MAEKPVKVVKNEEQPEADEIIAKAIINISDGVKRLTTGPLKRDTIVLLIARSARVSQEDVRSVLAAMESLQRDYVK